MEKVIKSFGNSIGISFGVDEKQIYDIELGDVIELEITKVTKEEDLKVKRKKK